MTYSRTLDGLRGVAILLVLFFHYDFILGCGWTGVQLFFVLSGYLITSILMAEKDKALGFYLKRFYWRRTLRIFPLYYAYLLLVAVVFLAAGLPEDFWDLFPFLATYTFNFYPLVHLYSFKDVFFMHFWSLSVEEQFYFVWPLVIFFCNRKQLQFVLIAVIIAAPLSRFVLGEILLNKGLLPRYVGETVYRFTLNQWDGFAFGALIPVFSMGTRKFEVRRILVFTILLTLALGAWNAFAIHQAGRPVDISSLGFEIGDLINFQHVWSYTLLDFFFFLVIVYIINPHVSRKTVDWVLGNPMMVYLGKISYGLYVYHFIIWMTFNKYMKHWFAYESMGFAVYVMICLGISSVSYFVFEKRILGFKDKFFISVKPVRE